MGILEIISGIMLLISGILIIVLVILQDSKQAGLSGTLGGSESSDSYLGKNGGRTMDAKLARLTKVLAVLFFVVTIGVNVVSIFFK